MQKGCPEDFGIKFYLFSVPTYMNGTHNKDDLVDVMMLALGVICAEDMVALNLEAKHKAVAKREARRASIWWCRDVTLAK